MILIVKGTIGSTGSSDDIVYERMDDDYQDDFLVDDSAAEQGSNNPEVRESLMSLKRRARRMEEEGEV